MKTIKNLLAAVLICAAFCLFGGFTAAPGGESLFFWLTFPLLIVADAGVVIICLLIKDKIRRDSEAMREILKRKQDGNK